MSTNVTMAFADQLQELIANSGKPIKELAEEIGISSGALSKYQNDAAEAGIGAIAKIAKYFDVSTDWLLGLSLDRKREATAIEKLGLSERAVNALLEIKRGFHLPSDKLILNAILEHEHFRTLAARIGLALFSAQKLKNGERYDDGEKIPRELSVAIDTVYKLSKGACDIIIDEEAYEYNLYSSRQMYDEMQRDIIEQLLNVGEKRA